MKVLHVIPSVAPKDGGPSSVVFEICNNLENRGIETAIATTISGLEDKHVPLERFTDYKNANTIFFKNQIGSTYKYSKPFEKWLLKNVQDYDLLHVHAVFNHSTVAASRACRRHGVPYIIRPLGTLDPWSLSQSRYLKKIFLKIYGNRIINNASGIQYTTEMEQKSAEKIVKNKKGFVVPLSVDDSYLNFNSSDSSVLQKFGISRDERFIMFLSRIHPKKGIEHLIRAFEKIIQNKNFKDLKLVIAGDGDPEYVSKIKTMANRNENIIFTGWLDGDEKKFLLSKSRLIVLPSYQENFGLCLIEAMALGVPVVTSENVNLSDEIVSGSAGISCTLNPDSIYNAVETLLVDEQRWQNYSKSAVRLVKNRFTSSVVASQIVDMYRSVTN